MPDTAALPPCPSVYRRRFGSSVLCELPVGHDGMHDGYDDFDNFYKWPREAPDGE